jgi:Tfp pilus assembly protein PilV
VLVASLVLLTGLVGVATATAATLRALADARDEEEAALVAARRMELLRATPCASRAGGVETTATLVARWTVAPHASGGATRIVVTITARADRTRARVPTTRRFETVAPC